LGPEIEVHIQKSPIPIVWLDTSVIINMAKWKFGVGGSLEETVRNDRRANRAGGKRGGGRAG